MNSPIKNFHIVSGTLYRSAQPTAEGMRWLYEQGIKTVINLRHYHSDKDEIGDIPLRQFHIVFATMWPEDRDVRRFLEIVHNKKNWPCLVHCLHGSDRTGMMCAIYRIEARDWNVSNAIKEMCDPKYGHHKYFKHLPAFIRKRYSLKK